MSQVQVIHDQAAPWIRFQLCYAAYAAETSRTQRDQRNHRHEAYAYAKALEIMAASLDQTPAPGIAREETLPSGAVQAAIKFLGGNAEALLGREA